MGVNMGTQTQRLIPIINVVALTALVVSNVSYTYVDEATSSTVTLNM